MQRMSKSVSNQKEFEYSSQKCSYECSKDTFLQALQGFVDYKFLKKHVHQSDNKVNCP